MMKKHFTLSISVVLLSITLIFLSLPTRTFAQGINLRITPSLIRIEAKPPADVWTPFTMENQSDQPVSLKIGYKAFDPEASTNGNVVFLNESEVIPGEDKKIFDKMQIVDDQNISHDSVALGPQQKIRLRLRILLPNGEPSSDYYFSLIFLQVPPQIDQNITIYSIENQKSYSTLQAGVAINILLAIGEKEAPQGSIQTFSAPWFSGKGPVPFNLTIRNSGSHFIRPHGEIIIKNMFGQSVGKVTVPPSIILADTEKAFMSRDAAKNASTAFGANLSKNAQTDLRWQENFLLGVYTATLTLSLSDKGPIYMRSINFIGFPVGLLIEIIIITVIITYIYVRVKRKLS